MNKQNHTVTLPMQDYEELMKIKNEHSYMETAIKEALEHLVDYGFLDTHKIRDILENSKQPF